MIDRVSKVGTATRYELIEHLLGATFLFFRASRDWRSHSFLYNVYRVLSQAEVRPSEALSLLAPFMFSSILVLSQYCLQMNISMWILPLT